MTEEDETLLWMQELNGGPLEGDLQTTPKSEEAQRSQEVEVFSNPQERKICDLVMHIET